MRSNLIVALAVGMLLLVIFGVTLISQYAGGPEPEENRPAEEGTVNGPPLLFATTDMGFDPNSEEIQKRYFQAFYEVTNNLERVDFWFKNPHKLPVTLTVQGRSCSSCTSANVAIVTPEAMRQFQAQTATSRLGVGVAPVPDLLTPLAYLALAKSLEWKVLDFDAPTQGVEVPAAIDENTPTWGVFQMVIKVSNIGAKKLGAEIGMGVGKMPMVRQVFGVTVAGVPAFDISPKKIDLGDFADGTAPRTVEVLYWSATREPGQLELPVLSVDLPDPFIKIGAPVPLTDAEKRAIFSQQLATKSVTRVTAGYRVPVTISRRIPASSATSQVPTQPDIGPYERQIGVAGSGSTVQSIAVTGNVVGYVALTEGNRIDLKDFNGRAGTERSATLVSDKLDLEMELIREESWPRYLKLELSPARAEAGRLYWTVSVSVPPDACQEELPANSFVVLRARSGAEVTKIRLPVKGRGFVRGR